MSWNEALLVLSGLLSAALIVGAWKLDKERLYSVILIFLILIAIGGGKIVEFFGFITNTGNIFYAGVFLATYFLIERYGRREGLRLVWIGAGGVVVFSTLLYVTLALVSTEGTSELSQLLSGAYSAVPRLAFASLMAYLVAQTFNVLFYTYLKQRFDQGPARHLWFRVNLSNILAQALDSFIFFLVAFGGFVAPEEIWEILLTGFMIKVIYVMLFSPLLYLNRLEGEEDKEYSALTLR
jgi:uncharacterized integral membrane protein (TIGR00697 family)